MSRPLLNLTIVELTQLFEDSAGKLNVVLDLLKELRYRSTPKANALNKRVMLVIAQNSSSEVLQSLYVPELEALALDCDDNPILRASLIEVLKTRGSAKSKRLLEQLSNVDTKQEIGKDAELPTSPVKSALSAFPNAIIPTTTSPPLIQKSALFIAMPMEATVILSAPVTSLSDIPPEVEHAFTLFDLSTTANWSEIEGARQRCVTKYRPGAGFDKVSTSTALKEITKAHSVLADYMKNKN
ncbi:MAG: hypothetical protein V4448_16345 [Pseudomonadota bacterium]